MSLQPRRTRGRGGRNAAARSRRPTARYSTPPPSAFFEKEGRVQRFSGLDRQVFKTIKTYQPAQITTSTSVSTFRSYAISVSNFSDIVEMASVFDQYRITYVECKFVPNITEALSSTPLSGGVYSVIDLDDANLFTSVTDALDYNSLQTWKPMETIQVAFRPRVAQAVFGSSVFGSFANTVAPWIDAASATAEHYGLKIAIGTTTTAVTYSPFFRVHCEWRMAH